MSKVGKKPIQIPQGVEANINGGFILIKGPKGKLGRKIDSRMEIKIDEQNITIIPKNGENLNNIWGLTRALIANMVKGVSEGFEKVLEFEGVGFKAQVKDKDLEMNLGFSHPVLFKGLEGINFRVEKNQIFVSGISNELVGLTASQIRKIKPPEPYKGKGIRYKGEIIKRKAGKKAVATG